MNSLKIVALVATITLAACGSREWRANPNKVKDVNTEAMKSFPNYNAQDPASLELLKSIGGASLSVVETEETPSLTETAPETEVKPEAKPETKPEAKKVLYAKVQVVLKDSCEDYVQELPLGNVAEAGEQSEGKHGSFESRCIGKDGSCDQVAVLFKHKAKGAQAIISFSKNAQGKYTVNPVQLSGVLMLEVDEFLKGQCQLPKTEQRDEPAIYYEQ